MVNALVLALVVLGALQEELVPKTPVAFAMFVLIKDLDLQAHANQSVEREFVTLVIMMETVM